MRAEKPVSPDIQPCNLFIVNLFFAVCTQWVYAGMSGVRVGLSYPAVEARAQHMPGYSQLAVNLKDRVWRGLQVMEGAALAAWSKNQ